MSAYDTAWESLLSAIGASSGKPSPTVNDTDSMTIDQKLKVAEIVALLSINEELSAIRHHGVGQSNK